MINRAEKQKYLVITRTWSASLIFGLEIEIEKVNKSVVSMQ